MDDFDWREDVAEVVKTANGIIDFMIGIQARVPTHVMAQVLAFKTEIEERHKALLERGNTDEATEFMEFITERGNYMASLVRNTGKGDLPSVH